MRETEFRKQRKKLGYKSIRDFCRKTGIKEPTASTWELGKSYPTSNVFREKLKQLGFTAEILVSEEHRQEIISEIKKDIINLLEK